MSWFRPVYATLGYLSLRSVKLGTFILQTMNIIPTIITCLVAFETERPNAAKSMIVY
jgi:hypothetical protein